MLRKWEFEELLGGQYEPGSCPFSCFTFQFDISTMGLGKLAGVKEAESETSNLSGVAGIDLVEFFEDFLSFFFVDARAVVLNSNFTGLLVKLT